MGNEQTGALNADDIIARDIRFNISAEPKRHWYGGSVHKTALADGLSLFLPEGERFFIRSLKHYASVLTDRELAREISGYSVQEAYHTREHEEYNRALAMLGYDVEEMERPIRDRLRAVKGAKLRLAMTCAIEHITATFSTATLRYPDLLDDADPVYRRLWMWHALEEIEHKAVALDVFDAVMRDVAGWKRYALRTGAMVGTLAIFILLTLRNVRLYAQRDGEKTGFRFWLKFSHMLFVDPGYWRRMALPMLSYFVPGFNPRSADDRDLVEKGRQWLARELAAGPASSRAASA